MTRLTVPVLLVVLLLVSAPASGQQDIGAAKDLYTAAKYEEALAVLDRLKEARPSEPEAALAVEQYRAMCLLALARKAEAEQAIEAVADLDPFYQPAEDDAAPWVRAAFRETRRKVLPAALQRLYGRAKQAYERKAMTEAIAGFTRVMKLLDDPDLALDKAAVGDMRMVTQGFLDLSHAAASATPPPAVKPVPGGAAPSPPSPAPTGGTAAPANPPAAKPTGETPPEVPAPAAAPATKPQDAPTIYDATSPDVVPPLPVRRDLPTWPFAPRATPGTAVIVEVFVSEGGTIDSVVVRQSAGKYYDQMVSQAARNWLYRPATKGGRPVKYRLLVKVVIASAPAETARPGSPAVG